MLAIVGTYRIEHSRKDGI
ncbi:rCG30920, partial [Rattus norvegicus]